MRFLNTFEYLPVQLSSGLLPKLAFMSRAISARDDLFLHIRISCSSFSLKLFLFWFLFWVWWITVTLIFLLRFSLILSLIPSLSFIVSVVLFSFFLGAFVELPTFHCYKSYFSNFDWQWILIHMNLIQLWSMLNNWFLHPDFSSVSCRPVTSSCTQPTQFLSFPFNRIANFRTLKVAPCFFFVKNQVATGLTVMV